MTRIEVALAVIGGATMLVLAAGFSSGSELRSDTPKPIATPTSSMTPAPPPTAAAGAPATGEPSRPFEGPGGINGCIPHVNC
jgi:hypothetical protein